MGRVGLRMAPSQRSSKIPSDETLELPHKGMVSDEDNIFSGGISYE
jgi:hypothetical protein